MSLTYHRYNNDAPYRALVTSLVKTLGEGRFCAGELRSAVDMAEYIDKSTREVRLGRPPQQWSPGERDDAVFQLRALASRIGDNDWPNELHLGDVIEKHILRYVPELVDQLEDA